jgi:hypothetical protein
LYTKNAQTEKEIRETSYYNSLKSNKVTWNKDNEKNQRCF